MVVGMQVLYDESDGLYHAIVSELDLGCGLGSWLSNSRIVHATSKSATGPFDFQRVLFASFAHEANVVKAPDGCVTSPWRLLPHANPPSPLGCPEDKETALHCASHATGGALLAPTDVALTGVADRT